MLISPVVEERACYERNADVLPFFAMFDGRGFFSWVDDTRQLVSGAEAFWQSASAFLPQKYTDA